MNKHKSCLSKTNKDTDFTEFDKNQLKKFNDNIKKITIWESYYPKEDKFKHNHIENEYNDLEKPIPKFKSQKSWYNYEWRKFNGFLIYTKVIY